MATSEVLVRIRGEASGLIASLNKASVSMEALGSRLEQLTGGQYKLNSAGKAYEVATGRIASKEKLRAVAVAGLRKEEKALATAVREVAAATRMEESATESSSSASSADVSATDRRKSAKKALTDQELALNKVMRGGEYAVLSMSQAVQDSAQFSMGAAQGFRAITNNVQVLAQSLVFAAESARKSGMTLKSSLWAAMKGPGGILLLISVATAGIEFLTNKFSGAAKAVHAAAEEVKSFSEVVSPFSRIGFGSSAALLEFSEVLSSLAKEDFAAIEAKLGRRGISGILTKLQRQGVDVSDIIEQMQRQFGLFGPILDPLASSVLGSSNAFGELAEELTDQAEKAKAVRDMWLVITSLYTEAELWTMRLGAEQEELNKQIDEQRFQLYRLKNLWSDLGRLDVVSEQASMLDAARKATQEISDAFDFEQGTVNILINLRSRLLQVQRSDVAANRVKATYLGEQVRLLSSLTEKQVMLNSVVADGREAFAEIGGIEQVAAMQDLEEQLLRVKGAIIAMRGAGLEGGGVLDGIIGPPETIAKTRYEIWLLNEELRKLSGETLFDLQVALTSAKESAIEDTFINIATNLGKGVSLLDSVSAGFLQSLGDMAVAMGKAYITFGISGIALKKFITNPALAVAAGAALVAVGTALRGRAGAILKSGTSGGSAGPSSYAGSRESAPAYFTSGGGFATFASGGITQSLSPFRTFPDALPGGYVTPGLLSGGYGKSPMMRVQLVASGRDLISAAGNEIAASGRSTYMSPFAVVGGGTVGIGDTGGGGGYGGEYNKLI